MPPEASTNLPVWRSVAPVNAPFSWPNRIDSTRFSGIAPQLTATNGLLRRSLEPWMARAISSLPTPDSPSIRTGMLDAAAFSPMRMTACIAGVLVMMSAKPSVPARLFFIRCNSPSSALALSALRSADMQPLGADRLDHEIDGAGAHRRDHIVDAAMGGLHDHRHADRGLAHFGEHAESVEIGHHQIEDDAIDVCAVGSGEKFERRFAGVARQRAIVEFLQRRFEKPALHRIVVDNKNGHWLRLRPGVTMLSRFGSLWGSRLNAVLSGRIFAAAIG